MRHSHSPHRILTTNLQSVCASEIRQYSDLCCPHEAGKIIDAQIIRIRSMLRMFLNNGSAAQILCSGEEYVLLGVDAERALPKRRLTIVSLPFLLLMVQ